MPIYAKKYQILPPIGAMKMVIAGCKDSRYRVISDIVPLASSFSHVLASFVLVVDIIILIIIIYMHAYTGEAVQIYDF